MLFRKTTLTTIQSAIDSVNPQFNGNLYFNETNRTRSAIRGRLMVRDSRGEGARRSASGRRTVSASWEAHRVFMDALTTLCPEVRITTALADYNGRDEFLQKFRATYSHNAGSLVHPVEFGAL